MKDLFFLFIVVGWQSLAFGNQMTPQDLDAYQIKIEFEQEMYELKINQEKALTINKDSVLLNSLRTFSFDSINDCVEWVYRGPASREEAVRACKGVTNMECVEWAFRGPASRLEAARACQNITSLECAEWVFRGPASRIESISACKDVSDMDCVEWVYRGPASRVESAPACAEERNRCY